MSSALVVAIAGLVTMLMVHTGALFYWGGSVRQMLRDHDARLRRLEDAARKGIP